MKTPIATLLVSLLLTSCGLFGGSTFAVPVPEMVTVAGWVERSGPGFDYDGDGFLTDEEFSTFALWLGLQVASTFPAPTPETPITAEASWAEKVEAAKAEGRPLPKQTEQN